MEFEPSDAITPQNRRRDADRQAKRTLLYLRTGNKSSSLLSHSAEAYRYETDDLCQIP